MRSGLVILRSHARVRALDSSSLSFTMATPHDGCSTAPSSGAGIGPTIVSSHLTPDRSAIEASCSWLALTVNNSNLLPDLTPLPQSVYWMLASQLPRRSASGRCPRPSRVNHRIRAGRRPKSAPAHGRAHDEAGVARRPLPGRCLLSITDETPLAPSAATLLRRVRPTEYRSRK
jgi:hypothetical protein